MWRGRLSTGSRARRPAPMLHGLDGSLRAHDDFPIPDPKEFSSELASARTYLSQFNKWEWP
jgi:hypothetical protein